MSRNSMIATPPLATSESGAQAAGQRAPIQDASDGAEEMTDAIPGARAGNRGR
jgi:hypothetical protein